MILIFTLLFPHVVVGLFYFIIVRDDLDEARIYNMPTKWPARLVLLTPVWELALLWLLIAHWRQLFEGIVDIGACGFDCVKNLINEARGRQ